MVDYPLPYESLNLQLELERINILYKIIQQDSEGTLYGKIRLLLQWSLGKTIRA